MHRSSQKLILICIFVLAAITFFTGIDWGLPSRESDTFLFGDRAPWTGEQIMTLAGPWDQSAGRGADIAMHPLADRRQPVELNDTDAKRAEIVRRYRLYSSQPDEMITFRSLSGMNPGKLKLDPKLYQYGGLWIYPVGGLLKIASLFHLVTLRTDLAFYLDHPGQFANFYVVARAYSALWGLAGVWVVYRLGKEWTGQYLVGATAAGLFASMPVVIDLAHEAKPHLAGTVLILLTVLAGLRYVLSGARRWWMLAGVLAGAAMAMVLTGYVAFAVLPVMALLREKSWKDRIEKTVLSGLIGIAIFALTNPYLSLNYLFHRELLHSNVGNYGTFYQPRFTLSAWKITARALLDGASLPIAVVGGLATCTLWRFNKNPYGDMGVRPVRASPSVDRSIAASITGSITDPIGGQRRTSPRGGFLLLAPAVLVLIQMVLLAEGKSAEYGRFGLLADVLLALGAAALVGALQLKGKERVLLSLFLIGGTLFYGYRYDANFLLDGSAGSTRREAVSVISTCGQQSQTLAVWAEPAPYCLPPVDLFKWHMVLMPTGSSATDIPFGSIGVRPVDALTALPTGMKGYRLLGEVKRPDSPISWANKPFEIFALARPAVSRPTTRP